MKSVQLNYNNKNNRFRLFLFISFLFAFSMSIVTSLALNTFHYFSIPFFDRSYFVMSLSPTTSRVCVCVSVCGCVSLRVYSILVSVCVCGCVCVCVLLAQLYLKKSMCAHCTNRSGIRNMQQSRVK